MNTANLPHKDLKSLTCSALFGDRGDGGPVLCECVETGLQVLLSSTNLMYGAHWLNFTKGLRVICLNQANKNCDRF